MAQKDTNWIFIRNGEVRKIFKNRKEAVKYFKELLKQTLKDFDKQDTIDEYDYPIKIPQTEIKPIEEREAYLSLLWKGFKMIDKIRGFNYERKTNSYTKRIGAWSIALL